MIIFLIAHTVLDFSVFKKVIEPELLPIVPEFEENERKRKAAADEAKAAKANQVVEKTQPKADSIDLEAEKSTQKWKTKGVK